jgi:dipeptidyl aminopeptidase/acylaminoacyl peptidase
MDETWKKRFTAPTVQQVHWAPTAPERLAVVSTESGGDRAWCWDLGTGERRLASDAGVGAEEALITPEGDAVVWWLDAVGDERGHWISTPFAARDCEARPLLPEVPDGWAMGLSMVPGAIAAAVADDDEYVVYVSHAGEPARALYRSTQPAGVGQEWPQGPGGLSADGSLLCVRHSEDSDIARPRVRVVDARTGDHVGEIRDDALAVSPAGWSPVPGDQRLVVIRETAGFERPWMWNLGTGALDPLVADIPGALFLSDWYPGGDALLLLQDHEASNALFRYELTTEELTVVLQPGGTISQASVRPDGTVWYRLESGVEPPRYLDLEGTEVLAVPGAEPAPAGRPFETLWFANGSGDRIQGWLIRPDGAGPFPTIVSIHGGPEYHNTDMFDARRLAYADHGFAVLLVNYRGSTGYGTAFRQLLQGDIGFPESEDVNAGLDHLIEAGIADPQRLFIEGWSWGGYLATLNAGLHPDRWRAVMAGIPVGDYVASHYECAAPLRAWDLATLGGSPMDLPDLYRERNPMTYVDRVRAPVLLIAGEHDTRCPLGQVMTYAHALRVRGKEVEVHLYASGHHANDVQEQILHVELAMAFFAKRL